MTTTYQDPIAQEWTNLGPIEATASEVGAKLAHFSVAELPPALTPYLAAAAAELAEQADVPWRMSIDPAQIALLRLLARITIVAPNASGPHTTVLLHLLEQAQTRGW